MADDAFYQYLKLFMDYFSVWSVLLIAALIWLLRNPDKIKALPNYIESAKIGDVELKLRKLEQKLEETESHVSELEQESARLNTLYAGFDPHAPVHELEVTRQRLKSLAGNLNDLSPVMDGLKPGADPEDVYAAAEILRARREFSMFDDLVSAVDRIASDPVLEGLRYHTVWTLASAVHRTVIAAVKHSDVPQLTGAQLTRARDAMTKLYDNPHVQNDSPDAPNQGIRGPSKYALDWIDRGLAKFDAAED
ncbi:hypothetical protein LCL97_22465 [Seohaeicola saemankumensis]|nr:hypothetical protein [Seohaeicola saemankumensis]MCA0873606.1 hypothetical protein [Seohaeicola saemankumensis]